MTDPLRLIEELDGSGALERRVLESATAIAPPAGAKAQLWSLLSGQVGGATTAAAAIKGTSVVATVKAVAAGTALGLAATAGAAWLFVPAEPKPATEPAVVLEPSRASHDAGPARASASAPAQAREVAPKGSERPRPRAPDAPQAPENESSEPLSTTRAPEPRASRAAFPDDLLEVRRALPTPSASAVEPARFESLRVAEARGLLRVGRAGAALAILSDLASALPNGVLVQEREALIVQALLGSGEPERARARAREFLQRYPNSPHAAIVSRALQ